LVDRDRSGGRKRLAEFAVPLQCCGDRGGVCPAEDDRDLPGGEPTGWCQVGRAERRDEGGHLLAQDCGGAADAAACGSDLPGGVLQVQAQGQRGGVPLAGGACTVDEFGVGGGCPGVVVGPVSLPPFCEAGSRIRQRALQHLEGDDTTGAAGGGQDSSPGGDAAFLLA